MAKYIPWQSWSGTKPALLRLPAWDYSPLPGKVRVRKAPSTPRLPKLLGYWCSWYSFGENISEKVILEQSKLVTKRQLPIDTIIIDDGWTKWGDWQQALKDRFPRGIKSTRDKIAALGYKTGLWLAPFMAAPDSKLLQEHPEFFLRDHRGQLINGFRSIPPFDQWFYCKYLLDFSQPAVRKYIFGSLDQMIRDWKVEVLKLDFLYAPYFNPHLENASVASQQVQDMLSYIRKKHPQVFVIACGCPFGDARGLVDAIRFSKDSTAPPPLNNWLRRFLYRRSIRELADKTTFKKLWQGSYGDTDVQLTDFDDDRTKEIFASLDISYLKGYGDDLRKK